MKAGRIALSICALALSVSAGLAKDDELLSKARQLFKPLPSVIPSPQENPATPQKVELGRKLFFDPRLSLSDAISCNSCHNIASYGVDNRETSLGHKAQEGARNAPTVFNAGFHIAQFWDGRARDLEEQAKGPILNPVEMAEQSEEQVVAKLKTIPGYQDEFKRAFPKENDPITYDNIARAIAAFERTLVTPSRFDRFLNGDANALSKTEREGLELFISKGCSSCHNGVAVGGAMYQKFGVVNPYPYQKDLGRYEVTKNEADKYVFKVPSLRNVERTYPYFHNGKVWDLREAVKIMGKTQLGVDLTDDEVGKIEAFLRSLTGEIPKNALMLPVLPPSSPDTPKPSL
ncbi:MAG: cytochrome-c peroxidase [Candidatus Methanosuratincola sp.]|jgi:cytochrome c peroxidase